MSARKRRVGQPASGKTAAVAAPGPRAATLALLLFGGLLAVYTLNFRLLGAGDSFPTRVLPFSVLREGNVDLDEFHWERGPDGRLPYYVHQSINDPHHIYSVSTIASALVVTPLYVLPAWWLAANGVGYDDVRARVIIVAMERFSAASLTALSASLLCVVLLRLTTWRWALVLTVIYALGTSTWSIASQALWAHGLAELCVVILCAIFLAPEMSRAGAVGAGLAAAVMVANRPQMIVLAALALGFLWVHHRRHVIAFAAIPAIVGAILFAYNRSVFQHVTGGYGSLGHFDGALLPGLAGLLASPNRGLFVYTPIMLFAVWGAVQVWRVGAPHWLRWLTIGVALHVFVHAKFAEWWAGYAYGPRYFTDVLPALTLFLVYGVTPWCRRWPAQMLVGALALYGVAVQAIGVYAADDRWNREPVPLEHKPDRVWDWGDLQIVRALRNGWRAGELAPVMLDAFRDRVPARVAPLTVDDLTSVIAIWKLTGDVRRGAPVTALVQITNRSAVAWAGFSGEGAISSRYLVGLLARFLDRGRQLPGVGDVIILPQNLSPDETVYLPLSLTAPPVAGQFKLELRITQVLDGAHGLVGRETRRIWIRVE